MLPRGRSDACRHLMTLLIQSAASMYLHVVRGGDEEPDVQVHVKIRDTVTKNIIYSVCSVQQQNSLHPRFLYLLVGYVLEHLCIKCL